VGLPFLVDGYDDPAERRQAIADEVQWYLLAASGEELPPDVTPSETVPPALLWLEYIEKWGLPYAGGWAQQPYYFMLDIEAARVGRERFRQIRETNRRMSERQ